MRAPWWLLICGLLPCAVALALGQGEAQRPDPFPIRRIQIGPERVAAELERAQKGLLLIMPRTELEAKIQKAALAAELTSTPPRLAKARFTAQLANQALAGSAEWAVV
ncbi:MAG TPA: hypothetical protein VE988_05280, partial [Gemmataceae bacterium]|nr:hypothetical protein [Gemmataceae bacterium]